MLIARRYPRFGRLLAALAASQLGDWLYNLALLAYVQQRIALDPPTCECEAGVGSQPSSGCALDSGGAGAV
jgi:hypothetical protein